MDQILNKAGSYWFSRKANKEINSVGDDINSLSSSIEGGAKWLVNKFKVGYKDSSVLRFSTTVTGYLEKGKLADIEGLKTKVMIWVKVTSISTEGSKIHFTAGMKKSRSRDAYEVLRDGVGVDKF